MGVLFRALRSEHDPVWENSATASYDDSADNAPYDGSADKAPVAAPAEDAFTSNATAISQNPVSDSHVDGLLAGSKWVGTVTYSFTDSASDYASGYGQGEPLNGFAKVTVAEQQAVNAAMAQISGFTNLTIQRNDEAGISDGAADIRIAKSADSNPTAYAYYPSNSLRGEGGDVWIGTSHTDYSTPVFGSYAYLTHIHELGHSFGLKHPHATTPNNSVTLPAGEDALEYTVMSYRSYVGGSTTTGYTNESFGYPQSYMMNDILALQKMYGADFGLHSSDSVYTWNETTGRMSIDGVGETTPGANRVFLTIWDGDGNDTYDMSNYSGGVTINLQPGSWSITSAAQKAYLGDGHYAQGNVYNAYQFNGDARSLIENAIGGNGNDTISGNAADNVLQGGNGNDNLSGQSGNDQLNGGIGNDKLDGGIGNDRLEGGIGDDILTGSVGDDLFVVRTGSGEDTITDFRVAGTDETYIDSTFVHSFAQLMTGASQHGLDTLLRFGDGGTLTLSNVQLGDLTEDDFTFSDPAQPGTRAPTNIVLSSATVVEHTGGAVVGPLQITDPDGDWVYAFALSDSRFEVVHDSSAGYSLKLKDDVLLENDTEPSIGIDITVTDPGGFSLQKHFTILVKNETGVTIAGTIGDDLVDATHTVSGQALPTGNDDSIYGQEGNDTLYGFGGDDIIFGGEGNDFLYGGAGNDRLFGQSGVDYLDGGDGDDTFTIYGSQALNDTILGGAGIDGIECQSDVIVLSGFSSASSIEIWYNGSVVGTSAANIFDFSGVISGSFFFLDAGDGNDTLRGSATGAELKGGAGNDSIYGGQGGDMLFGQAGVDYLDGGDGDDRFMIVGSEAISDTFVGGAGNDAIVVDSAAAVVLSGFGPGNSIEAWYGNGNALVGTSANNVFDLSGLTYIDMSYVDGGAGNDTLTGTAMYDDLRGGIGNDSLYGGNGGDTLYGQAGIDRVEGGDGNDTIVISGSEALSDIMLGGTGDDAISVVGKSKVSLEGFSAANGIESWIGNNTAVIGTKANNTLDFSGLTSKSGIAYVDGGAGNDKLTGSLVADDIRGGDGNDTITGGGGNDLLAGGKGADTFVFNGAFGKDTISGFTAGAKSGHDVIEFDHNQFADFAAVMNNAAAVGKNVVITLDADHSITLQAMTLSKLVTSDFHFV